MRTSDRFGGTIRRESQRREASCRSDVASDPRHGSTGIEHDRARVFLKTKDELQRCFSRDSAVEFVDDQDALEAIRIVFRSS
jgi:hypothetical protein